MSQHAIGRRGGFLTWMFAGMLGVFLVSPAVGQFGGELGGERPGGGEPIDPDGPDGGSGCQSSYGLYIEAIPGLTTRRYAAPLQFAVPRGVRVDFYQEACPDETVSWDGAQVGDADSAGVRGFCPMDGPGMQTVRVQVSKRDGSVQDRVCTLVMLDIPLDQVSVSGLGMEKVRFGLTESATNEETMSAFFGHSIAAVRKTGPNRYRTSVNKPVTVSALKTRPGEMNPLIEWRVNDEGVALGGSYRLSFDRPGFHRVSVGPTGRAQELEFEIYEVEITSHEAGVDLIPEAIPVVFTAVTNPPGFEQEINWIASTKYGEGSPKVGNGPTFVTTFAHTFALQEGGALWQWIGVKADNATRGQDTVIFDDLCDGSLGGTCGGPCGSGEVCSPSEAIIDEQGMPVSVIDCSCVVNQRCRIVRVPGGALGCAPFPDCLHTADPNDQCTESIVQDHLSCPCQ